MMTYAALPSLPNVGPLADWRVSVIAPCARTNLVINPSFETNTTSWTAVTGSIARSTAQQYHGAYSLAVTPTSASDTGAAYTGALSLTSGTTYAGSIKLRGVAGVTYSLSIRTTGGTVLAETRVVATGRWQWVTVIYTETSSTTRRLYVTKVGTSTGVFYVDGAQVEACGSEGVFATTYIDGDQPGLIPNQQPPAYLWTGTPHASISIRSAQTRSGGRAMDLRQFGLILSTIIGLGLAPPEHAATLFAQLDGGQYLDTRKTERLFTLQGRWAAATPRELSVRRAELGALLDRDLVATRQPLVLLAEHMNPTTGELDGETARIPALYQNGLEGAQQYLPTGEAVISFTQYLPIIPTHDAGTSWSPHTTIANADYGVFRESDGDWAKFTSMNSLVNAFARGLDGTLYLAGEFTNGGGVVGADRIVAYNPYTGGYSLVGAASDVNGAIICMTVGADGRVYIAGLFTNVAGIAAADGIAVYTPSTNTWAALGTGLTGGLTSAQQLVIGPNNVLYAVGGFTTAGGVAVNNAAQWDIAAGGPWAAMGTGLNGVATDAVWARGLLYVIGDFTTAGGISTRVAYWNPDTASWDNGGITSITGGAGTVTSIAVAPDGQTLVIAGGFTAVNGVSITNIFRMRGRSPESIGALGTSGDEVEAIAYDRDGRLWAGGTFLTAGTTLSLPDSLAIHADGAWTYPDIELGSVVGIRSIYAAPDGAMAISGGFTGTATVPVVQSVTNPGTAESYPVIQITGTANGVRLWSITNYTTGAVITFDNYTIANGEVITLDFTPTRLSFVSTFQGNITGRILPTSDVATFALQPGENRIAVLTSSASVTLVMRWPLRYASLEDTIDP